MSKMHSPWVALAVAGALAAAPAESSGQTSRSARRDIDTTFWFSKIGTLVIGNGSATVIVGGWDQTSIRVKAKTEEGTLRFEASSSPDFDKVAVHFSSDEGRTWTGPEVIRLQNFPEGMRFPFDPTLVPLPDGRVRLYFTSLKGRQFAEERPAIYSAVSSNAIDYSFEPGARFSVEGRPVIDCAVALHDGVFHLFAPDNGAGVNPGAARREPGDGPREGLGYHATSQDGLNFTRQPDLQIDGARRWLGNAQSDGGVIRFFGTGGAGGVWMAASTNGDAWTADDAFPAVRGADPGAVKLKDGGWLLAVTGPPRDGRRQNPPAGNFQPQARSPIMAALDANDDGTIDEWEIENATRLLRRLDRNGDGRLTPDELRPMRPEANRPQDRDIPRRQRPPGE